MYQVSQTPAVVDAYEAALVSSHRIRIICTVLDRNEAPVLDLELPRVLAGEVQYDAGADISRALSLTCLDPAHKLAFDSASPSAGALYADNFVRVAYGVETALGWVDVPVFQGPVTRFERNGPEVVLEAQGKESLALDPHLVVAGYTIPKSRQVADAVRDVMGRLGERRYHLGALSGRLRKHQTIAAGDQPWRVLVGGDTDSTGKPRPPVMAKAVGHPRLFYDGAGFLTVKRRGGPAVYRLTGDHVTSRPGWSYDVLDARNRVVVTGGTPKKGHGKYRGAATLPDAHPLSATRLARNGKPRYLTTTAEVDSLRSDAACRAHARTMLDQLAQQGLDASFECLPVPHLEEDDAVALAIDGYSVTFPLRTWTLPLVHDSAMSVGVASRTRFRTRRRRR